MKTMRRRLFLQAMAAATCLAAESDSGVLRGKLVVREGKPTTALTPDGQSIDLDADEPSQKVLGDKRLNGFEFEARGKFATPSRFTLNPAHTRPLLVRDKGELRLVTYWCEICSIRAYTPGPCACCQRYTDLDLRDPQHPSA